MNLVKRCKNPLPRFAQAADTHAFLSDMGLASATSQLERSAWQSISSATLTVREIRKFTDTLLP